MATVLEVGENNPSLKGVVDSITGIDKNKTQAQEFNKTSFVSILFTEGEGQISNKGEVIPFRKGDSFFLTADNGEYEVCGRCEALVTKIRGQE